MRLAPGVVHKFAQGVKVFLTFFVKYHTDFVIAASNQFFIKYVDVLTFHYIIQLQ